MNVNTKLTIQEIQPVFKSESFLIFAFTFSLVTQKECFSLLPPQTLTTCPMKVWNRGLLQTKGLLFI